MRLFLRALLILITTLSASSAIMANDSVEISDIHISGNKRTNKKIILNELPFKCGDSIQIEDIENILNTAKNNILNLSLFNFVDVTHSKIDTLSKTTDIYISVEERWYIWPSFDFKLEDRNISNWIREADWNKITINGGIKIYNMFGYNHKLTIKTMLGYQKGIILNYDNIVMGKRGEHVLGFSLQRQYSKTESFNTENDVPKFIKLKDNFIKRSFLFSVIYRYRKTIRKSHAISIAYSNTSINDTIIKVNPDYWGNLKTNRSAFRIKYEYRYDQRDQSYYPLSGYMIETGIESYLSGDLSIRQIKLLGETQYYHPISTRWNISTKLNLSLSAKNRDAYILDQAIGYERNVLRGYEYYVADGQNFLISNNTLKYNILPKKVVTLNFLSFLPRFNKIHFSIYGKTFFDIGYVLNRNKAPSNQLQNRLLYTTGAGIDIATYYDIVISIDYSINQFGERGFFFSFKSPLH